MMIFKETKSLLLFVILEILCITEKTSQKWHHIESVFADTIILGITKKELNPKG